MSAPIADNAGVLHCLRRRLAIIEAVIAHTADAGEPEPRRVVADRDRMREAIRFIEEHARDA